MYHAMEDESPLFRQPVEIPSILPVPLLTTADEPIAPSQEFLYLVRRIDEHERTIHRLQSELYQMNHRCCVFM